VFTSSTVPAATATAAAAAAAVTAAAAAAAAVTAAAAAVVPGYNMFSTPLVVAAKQQHCLHLVLLVRSMQFIQSPRSLEKATRARVPKRKARSRR
jgi:hypothetical protein